jgi:AAA15 family ATPase/GTPase
MKIRTIRLREFKRFDDLTIDLGPNPKKIVAMVGPNGCGKSSVFDAFEEMLKNLKNNGVEDTGYYLKSMFYDDVATRKTEYQRSQSVSIINDQGNSNFVLKSFCIRTSYRFASKINVSQISAKGLIIDDERPMSSIALDNRLQSNYERLLGNAYKAFENGDKTGNQVKQELIGKINTVLAKVLDIQISSFGNVVEGKGSLYFKKDNTIDFPYSNLSSGEKEVVDILIDLIVKIDTYDDTVFCIDEPELHLNTGIQRRLLVEIDEIIPENCQLWIATHSIGFLRALQEELKEKVQILDYGEKDYFQGAKTMSPLLPTRENWQRIFSTALDDLTFLVSPKRIIYCEGRPAPVGGVESGLDAIVFNHLFSLEYPDTLFISAGGTDVIKNSVLALQIVSKAFSGVSIFRLKDRDIKTDAERVAFLETWANNRMTGRREIENYLFDKEVLQNYSAANGIVFDEVIYDGVVTDILLQDLKLIETTIRNSVGSVLNITDFKKELRFYIPNDGIVYNELKGCIF